MTIYTIKELDSLSIKQCYRIDSETWSQNIKSASLEKLETLFDIISQTSGAVDDFSRWVELQGGISTYYKMDDPDSVWITDQEKFDNLTEDCNGMFKKLENKLKKERKSALSDSEFLVNLGNNIKSFRKRKCWSQQELADKTGIHRNYVISLEKGRQNPSCLVLRHMSKVFNKSINQIIK